MRQPMCGAAASWNTFFRLPKYMSVSSPGQSTLEGKPKGNCGITVSPWWSLISKKKKFTFVGRSPGFALFFSLPTRSQISMGHCWIDSNREKTEALGETPVPVPLCPPQIPHGLAWDRNRTAAATFWRLTTWTKLMQIVFDCWNYLTQNTVFVHYK